MNKFLGGVMPDVPFVPFPKIPRLRRPICITEKIDGTNASVMVTEDGSVLAGSRTRWITPQSDNCGFAGWVERNAEELRKLGPGHHFGEWWGSGIQRRYGLSEKRFSLFNVDRWTNPDGTSKLPTDVVSIVPVLYRGNMEDSAINRALDTLRKEGSRAVPGWMSPEGAVVFLYASHQMYKVLLENDETPKGLLTELPKGLSGTGAAGLVPDAEKLVAATSGVEVAPSHQT